MNSMWCFRSYRLIVLQRVNKSSMAMKICPISKVLVFFTTVRSSTCFSNSVRCVSRSSSVFWSYAIWLLSSTISSFFSFSFRSLSRLIYAFYSSRSFCYFLKSWLALSSLLWSSTISLISLNSSLLSLTVSRYFSYFYWSVKSLSIFFDSSWISVRLPSSLTLLLCFWLMAFLSSSARFLARVYFASFS